MKLAPLASLVVGVFAVSACGPGGALPVGQPTVASAIADKAPLVVDWPAGQRTDLEVTAHDGIAIVQVEPRAIKLLRNCHLAGSYGFLGVSTKEQVIRLEDAGEVALNLPLRGLGLAGELGGELGTSTALDVALVTIGRRRTIRTSAPRSALRGSECGAATHYIRGFDVGAFVLTTSEKSSASTVASLFGARRVRAQGRQVRPRDRRQPRRLQGRPTRRRLTPEGVQRGAAPRPEGARRGRGGGGSLVRGRAGPRRGQVHRQVQDFAKGRLRVQPGQ